MRPHRLAVTAPLALLLHACAPAAPSAAPAPDEEGPKRLRIVHTNDFHGHLLATTPGWADGRTVGGAAILAAHFDSAAARFDGATVVIDGGDVMQGTAVSNLSWGRSSIEAYNAAGYAAAAVGNHEFDWGQDTLRARIGESRFPWLASNLYVAGTREHPDWARPWVMVEEDGVRVGIVGVALSTTPEVVMAGRLDGLEFGSEAPAIDRYAREARAAGADFVVVTMHVGAICEEDGRDPAGESRGCEGEMLEVAEAVTEPVDAYFGGHTHRRVLTSVGGTPTLEARSYGTAYALADLERRGDSTVVLRREVRTAWGDEVDPDTAVARVVGEWGARVEPITARVVTRLAEEMPRRGPEHALGNLVADAFRAETGAHAALVNNGSIRRDLPAGPVPYGALFELQPFQNELVAIDLSGASLRRALENALDRDGEPDAHVAGMTVTYDPAAPRGERIREIRLTDGRVIGDDDVVTLGTTEFLAAGGDRYAALREGTVRRTGLVDLDALVHYLEGLEAPVRAPEVGRWRAVE